MPNQSSPQSAIAGRSRRVGSGSRRIATIAPRARLPTRSRPSESAPAEISSPAAQIQNYSREELEGSLVLAVVNFPPRQIGPVRSEVLTLGVTDEDGRVILLAPDSDVPLGSRIH